MSDVLIFLCGASAGVFIERRLSGWRLHIIENGKFTWRLERKP